MSIYDENENRPHSAQPQLPPGLIKKVLIGLAIVLVLVFASTMFFTVQEHERAAILTFGNYSSDVGAGLHFKLPYPIQQSIIVPANETQKIHIGYREDENGNATSVEAESLMITGDENIVSADAVVEWKISNIENYLFNIGNPESFLLNSASSSIRSVIGSTPLDYAITEGKTVIQGEVKKKLIQLQEDYQTGIQILDIKFQDIEPPVGEVQEAFKEVTNAREEKNTKINNARKYENDRIPKARGEAQALIEGAEATKKARILNAEGDVAQFNAIYNEYVKSPDVTETRLILETLQEILPNAQIFITDGNGSETVNYLPLNELMRTNESAGDNQ
jgi:membrane protease subunit HflK